MENSDFLRQLLESPGTSSFEGIPARLWRERARAVGARVSADAYGNSFARFQGSGGPRVMLAGHIDEIGLLVTYVDEAGFLYFTGVGIYDGSQVVGQRVRVVSGDDQTVGVVCRKAPHLAQGDDKSRKVKLESLWIDIGATSREEALRRAGPGSFAVYEGPVVELSERRWASKALDNRVGAFIALEAARRAAEAGASAEIVAAATTQEEIAGVGANVAAYATKPDLAIALDLTHASDVPDVDKKIQGDVSLGKGPVIDYGSTVHQGLARRLRECAEREGIPFQGAYSGRRTATDADDIAKVRSGAPTMLVSVPSRYMHSPNEIVDLGDVEAAVLLLERFLCSIERTDDLVPQD